MKRLRTVLAIAAVAAATAVVPLATADAAEAQSGCGFVGNETYVHCDPSTGVEIIVQDALGRIVGVRCVGWGSHWLGYMSPFPIVWAWYDGRVCWVHDG